VFFGGYSHLGQANKQSMDSIVAIHTQNSDRKQGAVKYRAIIVLQDLKA
jgi:hypothetical protein